MIFSHFKNAIAAQFKAMSSLTLLRVDINKDVLWQTYLASFPEGSNPLYRWFALGADSMVGNDFEAGLANLKRVAEKP